MFNDHYLKLKYLKLLALINASELKSEWPTFFSTKILSPTDPHESSHTIADWMIPYIPLDPLWMYSSLWTTSGEHSGAS